jgi:hypothetical protein
MLNAGTETLLSIQADFLVGLESAMTEWLHRRHEAVLDAKRLVARLRETQDINDILRAQQEWMSGAFRRLAADAAGLQSALAFATKIGREAEEKSRIAADQGAAAATAIAQRLTPEKPGRAPAPNERSETR